jgi:hypothetical protein
VGVYGGTFTGEKAANSYSLELTDPDFSRYNRRKTGNLIDGTPSGNKDFTVFGRINDYIWDDAGNNCVFQPNGVIMATRAIAMGAEL